MPKDLFIAWLYGRFQLGNQTDPTLEWGATPTPRVGLGSDRGSVTNNRCLKMTHIVLDANPHFLQTSLINPFLIAKKQFIYYHSCAACENLLLAIEEKKMQTSNVNNMAL